MNESSGTGFFTHCVVVPNWVYRVAQNGIFLHALTCF